MPSWIFETLKKHGLATVLVFLLLGMLVGWIPGLVTGKQMDQHIDQSREVVHLLRLICINTGHGQETVQVCLKGLDK